MLLTISNDDTAINFTPASIAEEVAQNVRFILATRRGTVPLHRAFGVEVSALDSPMSAAPDLLTAGLISAIEQYEPRARVTGVTWSSDIIAGTLAPTVTISLQE